jgi:hypothetical protein
MVPTQGACWFTQGGKEMDPSLTEVKEFKKKEQKTLKEKYIGSK